MSIYAVCLATGSSMWGIINGWVADILTLRTFWSLHNRRWLSPQSSSFLRPPITALISWMTRMGSTPNPIPLTVPMSTSVASPRVSPKFRGPGGTSSRSSFVRSPSLPSLPLSEPSSFTEPSLHGSLPPIFTTPLSSPSPPFPRRGRLHFCPPHARHGHWLPHWGASSRIELLNDPPVPITVSENLKNVSLPSPVPPSCALSAASFSLLHSLVTLAGWAVAPGYSSSTLLSAATRKLHRHVLPMDTCRGREKL